MLLSAFIRRVARTLLTGLSALCLLTPAASAVPTAPGYDIGVVSLPGNATSDAVVVEGVVFAGVGTFGAGTQQVVRVDENGSRVVAQGFNGLSGFAYDAINDRLIVGDNAGDLPGAITGDTIYGIRDPFGSGPAQRAVDIELLPSGSIPGYADVGLDPNDDFGDTLYVSDTSGSFPPLGRLLRVSALDSTTDVVDSGLAFAAGLAIDDRLLYYGEALLDFSGQIRRRGIGESEDDFGTWIAGLPGLFDLEIGPDGDVFATAGSQLLRIDRETGEVSTLASGFGFATGLAVDGDSIYVVDGGFGLPTNPLYHLRPSENPDDALLSTPEPSSALLVGLGLGVLGRRRARRRARGAAPSRSARTPGAVDRRCR